MKKGRPKGVKKVAVQFRLSEEIVKELDKLYAKYLLEGKKTTKSEIVEKALREHLKNL